MDKFAKGETVALSIEIRDEDDVLVDPTTSTQINIWDSSNTLKVDNQNMTMSSTGLYIYYYTIPDAGSTGIWRVMYVATSGSYNTRKRSRFAVVQESILD